MPSKDEVPMGKVIVDTDFLNHILKTPNGEELMQKIVDFYGYELVMHPWVYEREIKGISTAADAYVQKNVKVLEYSEFLETEDDEALYEIYFLDLHRNMNRNESVDGSYRSFKTYNRAGKNLGEIHSVILARFSGIPLLLSDDYNAKEIAAKRINADGYLLDVKKSFDIMCDMVKADKSALSYNDALAVIRNYKQDYQKAYIKTIKQLYTD